MEVKEKGIIKSVSRKPINIAFRGEITYQQCSCCGEWKELNEKNFYKDNTVRGFKGICKECKKTYYKNNRIKKLAYQNAYAESKLGVTHRSNDSYNKVKPYELEIN